MPGSGLSKDSAALHLRQSESDSMETSPGRLLRRQSHSKSAVHQSTLQGSQLKGRSTLLEAIRRVLLCSLCHKWPVIPEQPVWMQLAGGQATTLEVRLAPV